MASAAKKDVEVGITAKKDHDFSEWYTQVVQKAGLADIRYGVQGFIVHMPWGFRILRRLYELLEEEVEKDGHQPFLFPLVIKKENLAKEQPFEKTSEKDGKTSLQREQSKLICYFFF